MIGGVDSNLQALSAFSTVQAVAANNVANVLTPGFSPSRVDLQDTITGGVQVADIRKSDSLTGPPATVSAEGLPGVSGTDLAVEFTTMIANQAAFSANTAAITANDQMAGTLLNMYV